MLELIVFDVWVYRQFRCFDCAAGNGQRGIRNVTAISAKGHGGTSFLDEDVHLGEEPAVEHGPSGDIRCLAAHRPPVGDVPDSRADPPLAFANVQ
jgi:hypothetical protein